MRRPSTGIFLVLALLVSLLGLVPVAAQSEPTVVIYLGDGGWSVPGVGTYDPATRTATLTRNLANESIFIVNSSGITLDGGGYASAGFGGGWSAGVYVQRSTGITIQNMTVRRYAKGIHLWVSSDLTVVNNICEANAVDGIRVDACQNTEMIGNVVNDNGGPGIDFNSCTGAIVRDNRASGNAHCGLYINGSNHTLTGNVMEGNGWNFHAHGTTVDEFQHSVDTSNLVDGKPIYFLGGESNRTLDASSNAGTVYLIDCNNVTVRDLNLTGNYAGVYLMGSSDCRVEHIESAGSEYGIFARISPDLTLADNIVRENGTGVYVEQGENSTLMGNVVTASSHNGIEVRSSPTATLIGNQAEANALNGITLDKSPSSMLRGNTTSANGAGGLVLYSVAGSTIVDNTMMQNAFQGLYLNGARCTLSGNVMAGNPANFGTAGLDLAEWEQLIDTTNLVEGKPLYYLYGVSDRTLDASSNAGVVYLINCRNVTLTGLNLVPNEFSVFLLESDDCRVDYCSFAGSLMNLYIGNSDNNTISDNLLSSEGWAIYFFQGVGNVVERNTIEFSTVRSSSPTGIWLGMSDGITIANNTFLMEGTEATGIQSQYGGPVNIAGNLFRGGYVALEMTGPQPAHITRNTITGSTYGLMLMDWWPGNEVYNNNFFNVSTPVYKSGNEGYTSFFLPEPVGGNYYSDWTGPDADNDAFVDNPYVYTLGGHDDLPWAVPNGWLDETAPTTTATLAGEIGPGSWYRSGVEITLSASDNPDGVGVKRTEYSLDGITWQAYAAPVILTGEGTHTFSYRSFDRRDHLEVAQSQTIGIDLTPPMVTITMPQVYAVMPVGAALEFSASDALSGLASVVGLLDSGSAMVEVSSGYVPTVGVYTLVVAATDNAGNVTTSEPRSLVIYDPVGGFASGSGWFNSPAGLYIPDSDLTGKAHFGFTVQYHKGEMAPTGRFSFRLGNLDIDGVSFDWLVVTGARAQFAGAATGKTGGEYRLLVTTLDRDADGSMVDRLRVKVWDAATNTLIYDNQPGTPESADPIMPIGAGSLVVHK